LGSMGQTLVQYPSLGPVDESYTTSFPVILKLRTFYQTHSINNDALHAAALTVSDDNAHMCNTYTDDGSRWYGVTIFKKGPIAQAAILFPYHTEKDKLTVLQSCSDSDLAALLRNEIDELSSIEAALSAPESHSIRVEAWNDRINGLSNP